MRTEGLDRRSTKLDEELVFDAAAGQIWAPDLRQAKREEILGLVVHLGFDIFVTQERVDIRYVDAMDRDVGAVVPDVLRGSSERIIDVVRVLVVVEVREIE